ncbi:MAG: hypothetical protein HYX68_14905 [Planctomycetes bacterium]|nr:hypothetical protein [Planctomycetota bacterium]
MEVLVEADGRIHLFLSGEHTEEAVEVLRQLLIAQVKRQGESGSTSVVLRPAEKPGASDEKTSHFIGRFSPELMESRLSVSIVKLAIDGRDFAFQFELPDRRDGKKRAAEIERALVLASKGKYTQADVEAAEKQLPSEKYLGIIVVHDLRAKTGDSLCPVTRAKTDPRIRWQVNGRTYQFCCPPCIVEFVGAAQASSKTMVAPEDLVKKD